MDCNFKDVKGQLEGKIAFKGLIATTWKKYDFGPEIKVDPADFRGVSQTFLSERGPEVRAALMA